MKTVSVDFIGGMLLVFVGLSASFYSVNYLDPGTVRMMGAGMFPAALGVVLAALGGLMAISALLRPTSMPQVRVLTPLFVLLGVAVFALVVRPFGLIPAILAVTVVSSFAELKVRPVSLAILCAALCLIGWLTFGVGLGLPIAMFRWPF